MEAYAQHHEPDVLASQVERSKVSFYTPILKVVLLKFVQMLKLMPIMKMCSDRLMEELQKHEGKELQMNT